MISRKNQAYSNQIQIWNLDKIGIQKHKFPIGTTSQGDPGDLSRILHLEHKEYPNKT